MKMWGHNIAKYYKILRGYTLLCAVILIITVFSPLPTQTLSERIIRNLEFLVYSIVLLIPHRWTLSKRSYPVKMFILLVGGVFFIRKGIGIVFVNFFFPEYLDFLDRPIMDVGLFGIFALIFGIASPLTLYMKKRESEDNED